MTRDDELSPEQLPEDRPQEQSLRPRVLAEFIGQEKLKSNLKVFLTAARQREEALDHVLLYGPPGLGKTTIAHIIATEMNAPFHVTTGPALERPGDLVGIVTNLEPGAVLFIDEIHRLSKMVEEILYPAMEDYKIDLMIGKGPAARSVRLDLPRFTIIGATTRQGLLTGPFRDRFGIVSHFNYYDAIALHKIITRSSAILGFQIEDDAAQEISRRARGTPRIANRLLARVRDFAQVDGHSVINLKSAKVALDELEIDSIGLDRLDHRILLAIIEKYEGGPVGIETIAATIGEDSGTIEDVYEPYLMQLGLLQRTPRGRVATATAYRHLGREPRKSDSLFGEQID
ncbi:MAG: Holliday junction branch migration DNA helicase RuvB [Armatimonadetes bacterium]|nr:Holliday junction branch migration DNA helicase RuvB [Armatimonadota bacterium]